MQTVRGRRARWAGAIAAVPLLVSGAASAAMAAPAAGNAQPYALAATATIAQDGSTALTLGVSTNSPTYAVPTTLKHVQLKSFNAAGEQVFTKNLKDVATPAGTTTLSRTDLQTGQRVKVQAQAQTGSTKNTQVLETEVAVLQRPDLTVASADAVAQAAPNSPISIATVVSELNGDLGATGTLTVSEGASVLDTASVTVTPDGSTNTALAVSFADPGTHVLTVAVGSVTPAEWDTTNNSTTVTVEVIQPNQALEYSATYQNMYDYSYNWVTDGNGDYCWYYGYGYCQARNYHRDEQSEWLNVNYWTQQTVTPAGTFDISIATESGPAAPVQITNLSWDGWAWYGYDQTSNTSVYIQPNGSGSNVQLNHNAGTWNYSDRYCDYYYYGYCYDYSSTDTYGTYWNARESITVGIDVPTTTGEDFGGSLTIGLSPYNYSWDYSYWDYYYGYVYNSGRQNYVYGNAWGVTTW
jgi:hypothetical protein